MWEIKTNFDILSHHFETINPNDEKVSHSYEMKLLKLS